ncbi:hypothetical protein YC2023_060580 [Brassica napus]
MGTLQYIFRNTEIYGKSEIKANHKHNYPASRPPTGGFAGVSPLLVVTGGGVVGSVATQSFLFAIRTDFKISSLKAFSITSTVKTTLAW